MGIKASTKKVCSCRSHHCTWVHVAYLLTNQIAAGFYLVGGGGGGGGGRGEASPPNVPFSFPDALMKKPKHRKSIVGQFSTLFCKKKKKKMCYARERIHPLAPALQ